jgi:hypothetical protein
MKKIVVVLVIFFASSTITLAQPNSTELNFQKNRTRYSQEHFSEGEDASSGFDYVYFRNGKNIVMIRTIWSATYTNELRIEDMYFEGDLLALFRRSTARKKLLAVLKTGRSAALSSKEEMHFKKGMLARWIENGKPVDKIFWPDAEKSTLEKAKGWINSYTDLKNGNQ